MWTAGSIGRVREAPKKQHVPPAGAASWAAHAAPTFRYDPPVQAGARPFFGKGRSNATAMARRAGHGVVRVGRELDERGRAATLEDRPYRRQAELERHLAGDEHRQLEPRGARRCAAQRVLA